MYYQSLHQKLYHIAQADYDDFVAILVRAKQARITLSLMDGELKSVRVAHPCNKEILV